MACLFECSAPVLANQYIFHFSTLNNGSTTTEPSPWQKGFRFSPTFSLIRLTFQLYNAYSTIFQPSYREKVRLVSDTFLNKPLPKNTPIRAIGFPFCTPKSHVQPATGLDIKDNTTVLLRVLNMASLCSAASRGHSWVGSIADLQNSWVCCIDLFFDATIFIQRTNPTYRKGRHLSRERFCFPSIKMFCAVEKGTVQSAASIGTVSASHQSKCTSLCCSWRVCLWCRVWCPCCGSTRTSTGSTLATFSQPHGSIGASSGTTSTIRDTAVMRRPTGTMTREVTIMDSTRGRFSNSCTTEVRTRSSLRTTTPEESGVVDWARAEIR